MSSTMAMSSIKQKASLPIPTGTTIITSTTMQTDISMMRFKSYADNENLIRNYYNIDEDNKDYDKTISKAKATKINCENYKQQHQPEQQLQYDRKQLDYNNYYEFNKKTLRIPRVQNEKNIVYEDYDYNYDYVNVNDNINDKFTNDTITIDHKTTTLKLNNKFINNSHNCMVIPSIRPYNQQHQKTMMMGVNGCGSNIGANCSNCRNIKILLRLSLRYFYDINCEFVKNII